MDNPLGTEIDATAKWLDERGASGAARLLRRLARQRDEARQKLIAKSIRPDLEERTRTLGEDYRRAVETARHLEEHNAELRRDVALMRTDLARCQNLVERAGWMPDAEPRRLWRWRNGWWELAHRKRNLNDGYPDTGWYLWGPPESYFGEWIAPLKADATREADRLITQHLAAVAEAQR